MRNTSIICSSVLALVSVVVRAGDDANTPVADSATGALRTTAAPTGAAELAGAAYLPTLIRLGVSRNPAIKAAQAEWLAAIARYPQATALPDPMIRYDYFGDRVETRVGPQDQRIQFSQPFPFPGTLRTAGDVVLKEVVIQSVRYDQVIRDVIVDIKLSFQEFVYLERAVDITRQNQNLLNHILKIANAAYADDKAKLNDVLKAQSQLAQLSYDLILLRELQEVEIARLNTLLDLPTENPLGPARVPPLRIIDATVMEFETLALARRQEIGIATGKVEKTEVAIKLARLKTRPMFNLNGMWIDTNEALNPNTPDSGTDPWTVGMGVTIPWWVGKNRAAIEEAAHKHEAALNSKADIENRTRATVKSVYFRLENARRLIELYEKNLIPQATAAMEVAETWSTEGGAKDIAGFLETQSVWLNFNLARLRAIADYQQALARMERLIGGTMPAGGIGTEDD